MDAKTLYLVVLLFAVRGQPEPTKHLELSAVVSNDHGHAAIQCWEMATPFQQYPTTGEAITGLAQVDNVSYVVLPPRSDEGIHKPPHPMFFALLSGQAHITLPRGDNELWVTAGIDGLIVAVDTTGEGHITEYPSDKPSVALQIPFRKGQVPEHKIKHDGPCVGKGQAALGHDL